MVVPSKSLAQRLYVQLVREESSLQPFRYDCIVRSEYFSRSQFVFEIFSKNVRKLVFCTECLASDKLVQNIIIFLL